MDDCLDLSQADTDSDTDTPAGKSVISSFPVVQYF